GESRRPRDLLARRLADAALSGEMRDPGDSMALSAASGMYRETAGDDVFEIASQDDGMALISSGGAARIEAVGPNRYAPERPITHMVLMPDGTDFRVEWCGEPRRYRRVGDAGACPHAILGRWRHDGAGVTATITQEGDAPRLLLQSEFGALTLKLSHLDDDLFLALPETAGRRNGRPWSYTLRAFGDRIELSSDRIKRLAFARIG